MPALAGPFEEGLLREAADEAGFSEVELVPEPVAAARAWLMETGESADAVCVLDCGGGTIDWAYLRRDGNDFRIVAECPPGGDRHVGGYDVDLELLNQVAEALPAEAQDALEERQPYYLAQVRAAKERVGRGLPIPPLRVAGRQVQLTEKQIQDAVSARFIEQTCTGLADYLERVKALTSGQLPPVLLVGGSAWLIGLKETLEQRLTCRVLRWERSDYAVALGALNNGAVPRALTTVGRSPPIAQAVAVTIKEDAPAGAERTISMQEMQEAWTAAEEQSALSAATPAKSPLTRPPSPRPSVVPSRVVLSLGRQVGWLREGWGRVPKCVKFSPDGCLLASVSMVGSTDGRIKLWEVAGGREVRILTGYAVTFAPDGQLLASSDGNSVKLSEVASGREVRSLPGESPMAFTPDGHVLAARALDSGKIKLWEVASGREIQALTGHTRSDLYGMLGTRSPSVSALAFAPDGRLLVSSGSDRTIKLWEVASGRELRALPGEGVITPYVTLAPNGQLLASGGSDTIRLWDVTSGRELRNLSGHGGTVNALAFSPDGRLLASGSLSGYDNTIKLWEVASGREVGTLTGHTGSVNDVAFSPDGQLLASCSSDRTVKLWQ